MWPANSLIALNGTNVAPFEVFIGNQDGYSMKTRIPVSALMALCAIAAWTFVTAPAAAQSARPGIQEPATVSDTELRSFASAAVEVKRVADSYLPVLAGVQTFEEKTRVESAAYSEIRQIVENEGFTVSRFNEILSLASVSPDLADRIRLHMHGLR